jgi:hypothetical protein
VQIPDTYKQAHLLDESALNAALKTTARWQECNF